MFNIYDEIMNGNLDLLCELTDADTKNFIANIIGNNPNKKEILNRLLPILRNSNYWYGYSYYFFKIMYLDNDFKEYTFYLLHNEYVRIVDFTEEELKNILEYTSWGFDYVLSNLSKCLDNTKIYKIISALVNYVKDDKNKYELVKQKIMEFNDQEVRDSFIISSLNQYACLSYDDIKSNLYKNTDDYYYQQEVLPFCEEELYTLSSVPARLIYWCKKDEGIRKLFLDNFDLFFNAEQANKMKIIEHFYDNLPVEIKSKYQDIYKLYKTQPISLTDCCITNIMNNNMSEYLINILKNQDISYITSGSTTQVFRVGDLVLKFTKRKHEMNTEKDLFLILKTDTKYIYDKNNSLVLILEIQKYLDREHNNSKMQKDDVNNFFVELGRQGYEVTDPNCLDKNFENFGFLDDYHEANLGEYSSYEELPEWFKERPIVLYDVDLIYKKDCKKKKRFSKISY